MNSLLEQDLKEQIEQRLQEAEQRIEAGRLRRQEILSTISSSQRCEICMIFASNSIFHVIC